MSVLPHFIRASHTLADNTVSSLASPDSGIIIPSLPSSHTGFLGTSSSPSSSGFFSRRQQQHHGDFQQPYNVSVSVGNHPFYASVSSGSAAGRAGRAALTDGRPAVINGEVNAQPGRTFTATTTPLTLQQAAGGSSPTSTGIPPQGSKRSPVEGASPPAERAAPSAEYSPRAAGTTPITGTPNRSNPHYIEDILGRHKDNMDHGTTGQSQERIFNILNVFEACSHCTIATAFLLSKLISCTGLNGCVLLVPL